MIIVIIYSVLVLYHYILRLSNQDIYKKPLRKLVTKN